MVRFESDPDNDSAVSEAITDYFRRNPEDLMEDGSRPTVLLLAREKSDAGTFRQFLWWTLITVAIKLDTLKPRPKSPQVQEVQIIVWSKTIQDPSKRTFKLPQTDQSQQFNILLEMIKNE